MTGGYWVVFAASARRDLARVPPRPLQRELTGLWSARRGPYRIVHETLDDEVIVEVVRIDQGRFIAYDLT